MSKQHRPDIILRGGLGVKQTNKQTNLECFLTSFYKKKKTETKHKK